MSINIIYDKYLGIEIESTDGNNRRSGEMTLFVYCPS